MSKTGIVTGTFDLFHAGHVAFITAAKREVDHLIIALQVDPSVDRKEKHSPVQSVYERFVQLRGAFPNATIIPYETEHDLANLLAIEDIQVRFLGSEYLNKRTTGQDTCDMRDIDTVCIPRLHTFSSSELRERVVAQHEVQNEKSRQDRG